MVASSQFIIALSSSQIPPEALQRAKTRGAPPGLPLRCFPTESLLLTGSLRAMKRVRLRLANMRHTGLSLSDTHPTIHPSIPLRRRRVIPVVVLQCAEELAEELILAGAEVAMVRAAEEGAQLMLADFHVPQR
jgi:hypothetical protein